MNAKIKSIEVEVQSKVVDVLVYDFERSKLKVIFKQGNYLKKSETLESIKYQEFHTVLKAQSVGQALIELIRKKKNSNQLQFS